MVYEGTVIGLKKHSAVVMTSDCQFQEIKRTPAMSGGRTVRFTDADLVKPVVKSPLRFTAIAASLLVCFVLAYALLQGITDRRAFAYINVEVNPALEISLDKEMKAMKVSGINRDGQDIAKGLNLQGQDAAAAVQAVLGACAEGGYINGDHSRVLIATTFPAQNEQLQQELDYRVWEAARKSMAASRSGASIYIVHVEPALREQAIKKGVSPGRYLLWQDAQSSGLQLDLHGPLSGPAFSRSAGRLSLPFAERGVTDNHSAPVAASPAMQGERAGQGPSSPPGSEAASGMTDHKLREHAAQPEAGTGTDNRVEKQSDKLGNPEDTAPNGPGKPETTNDKTTGPDKGADDTAKPKSDSPSANNPAGGTQGDNSGSKDSRSQGSGSSDGSGGSGSGGKSSGSSGGSSGSGGGGRR